ncbi:manganese-dependent inorganic pyrophosphatase [Candidatus Methanophagaceae archaeon]|nr:manganese-dependent inorganic pyrophosphatase [Methanophagales archaeon]
MKKGNKLEESGMPSAWIPQESDAQKQVFVIGHKNPDCDSVCSAIGYAYFKNSVDKRYQYVPAKAGELNAETLYVLDKYGFEQPIEIESLVPTASDMNLKKPLFASPYDSLKKVASVMKEANIHTVPVVDAARKLSGIIGLKDIAAHYIDSMDFGDLSTTPIDLNILVETLDAKVITNPLNIAKLTGTIFIAAMQRSTVLQRIGAGDVVILGDRTDIQMDLINSGCSALIITGNTAISPGVVRLATEKGTLIVSSPYHTFATAKLLALSTPLHPIMSKDVPVAGLYTRLAEIRRKVAESKYRCVLLVDGDSRLIGIITRTDLLQPIRKKVILVDHNEISQAVDGVQEADILEIIDHHRVGDISTLRPIHVHNEPIGSTCTIVARFMLLRHVDIQPAIAGLLLSGILSDTLILSLSTTTDRDKEIAHSLASIIDVEIEEYGKELLTASINITGKSALEILQLDFKEFILGKKKVGVGQIMVLDDEEISAKEQDIKSEMERLRTEENYDLVAFLVTNPLESGETILVKGDKRLIEKAFAVTVQDDKCVVPETLSRKKDFIPAIGYFCGS